MATNSSISVTEGSGKNIATYSFSESTTKELQRLVINDSTGTEVTPATAAGIGAVTETAPASDTASSGLNGRLQRIAQRLTTLIAGIPVFGLTASGSSLTSAPLTAGGLAKTANPTAVADAQVVNSLHDKLGKQVVVGSIRDLKADATITLTSTTSETTLVAAIASTFNDVYGLIIENTSATATEVSFRDTTGGTVRFNFYVPAGDTRGFMLPESAAWKQATVNTNWTAQCGTSVASVKIAAMYVKNI